MQDAFEQLVAEIVRESGARGRLARELRREFESYFFDVAADLADAGLTDEGIVAEGRRRFGNPSDVARGLDAVHQIALRRTLAIASAILGVAIGILVLGFSFSDPNAWGFQQAMKKKYGGYETVLSYVGDHASSPCATDGLGIRSVPFGTIVSRCDVSWYYGLNFALVQVSGPRIPADLADYGLADPADMDARAILRELYASFVQEERARPVEIGNDPIVLATSTGDRTVYPEQVTEAYQADRVTYALIAQKNMNVPLLGLGVRKAEFAGLVGRVNDGPWQPLLDLTGKYAASGKTYDKANVLALFFDHGLYVDIVDAGGAGSGEGNLLRLQFDHESADGPATWKPAARMYYVPEQYEVGTWDGNIDLLY